MNMNVGEYELGPILIMLLSRAPLNMSTSAGQVRPPALHPLLPTKLETLKSRGDENLVLQLKQVSQILD